jgi:hypothetical protein
MPNSIDAWIATVSFVLLMLSSSFAQQPPVKTVVGSPPGGGAYAPAGTSEASNAILIDALAKVVALLELRDRQLTLSFEPKFSGPKELESRVQQETNQWHGNLVRSGFQLQ